jgi:hypothetical protein
LVTAVLTGSEVDGDNEGSRVQATMEAAAPFGGPNSGDLRDEEEGEARRHGKADAPTGTWTETRRGLTDDWG